jgi:hypothetical protein
MKFYVKKVPPGGKLRVRRYDGQDLKIYGVKIFNFLIGVSFT